MQSWGNSGEIRKHKTKKSERPASNTRNKTRYTPINMSFRLVIYFILYGVKMDEGKLGNSSTENLN